MILLVILGLVMAIVAVLFALQNAALVTINFGVWQLEQSLAIVLIITLGIGILISTLLSLPTILKLRWRNGQQKTKLDELQTKLKTNNQTTLQQQQSKMAQQEAMQELVRAFELTDGVTGLLNKETTIALAEHLLHQMQQQPQNPRYASLVVMLFALVPAKSYGKSPTSFADLGSENAVYKAIAKRLRSAVTPDSFLGITERKRAISLVLGLRGREVAEYASYLQSRITEVPLQKADGTVLPFKMSIGAVVVDPSESGR